MGTSHWSNQDFGARQDARKAAGKDAFDWDKQQQTKPPAERKIHETLNPLGVRMRESRDSQEHPDSLAIAVLMDVTGSMRETPKIAQENLSQLMSLLIRKNYVPHPQIMVGAIGDVRSDTAPLQLGQFESGLEIDNDLSYLFLEGGGGGQMTESYDLAIYFMARHTSIDCYEKRNQKGFLFILGDERPLDFVEPAYVKQVIGDDLVGEIPAGAGSREAREAVANEEARIPIERILAEAQDKYNVYYLMPNMAAYYKDPVTTGIWGKLLGGENVVLLDDPSKICETIASVIGVSLGVVDIDGVRRDLVDAGVSSHQADVVTRAVANVRTTGGPNAVVPSSGTPLGVAKL